MTKMEFIATLYLGLSGLPTEDIEERVLFYTEMIDDRIEEGMPEEEAVAAAGDVDEIISGIFAEIPLSKIVKKKIKPRKLPTGAIVAICVGAPLWVPLLIAVVAVALSIYISLWSIIISLWATAVSLSLSALGFILGGAVLLGSNALSGAFLFSAALLCAGLGILFLFLCKAATKGVAQLTKNFFTAIKRGLTK